MSEPLARLYDLALRTLDEQERRADALRGRLGPVLAAAALGASLLSGPVVGGERPASLAGRLALVVAIGGLGVAVVATFRLLLDPSTVRRIDPYALMIEFGRDDLIHDEEAFYKSMIARVTDHVTATAASAERLTTTFTAIVCGILAMLCGLAVAAIVG